MDFREICANINKQQNYYSLVRQNKMSHQFYSRFRTFVTNQIRQTKINSFAPKFEKFKGDCTAGPNDHYQYLKGNNVKSLFSAPVSSADVEEIILSLRNKPFNINTFSTSVLKRIIALFFMFCVILSTCHYELVFFRIV